MSLVDLFETPYILAPYVCGDILSWWISRQTIESQSYFDKEMMSIVTTFENVRNQKWTYTLGSAYKLNEGCHIFSVKTEI